MTVDLQGSATDCTLQFGTAALLIMPGTSIIEAIGQSASILFSRTTGKGMNPKGIHGAGCRKRHEVPSAGVTGSYHEYRSKYR
jgi:hypothetical protein